MASDTLRNSLAAALRTVHRHLGRVPESEDDWQRFADAILATPEGETFARQQAIGAAVERLPGEYRWSIERVPLADPTRDWLAVWGYRVMRSDGDLFYGPTIPEAVDDALAGMTV